jgi:hypothetical protein
LAGLFDIGYQTYLRTPDDAAKWYVELERQDDVGMIDLHKNPPGHAFFYTAAGEAKDNCQKTTWRGGTAYIPSATYHAFMLMIHDQFQDADYWIGRMDLRHLLDLHDLANSPEDIDWNLLASFCSGSLAKNAIETQLVTLSSLLGTDVPPAMLSRRVPRLQNWRRLTQIRFPVLGDLFLTMTLLDYLNYRRELGREETKANDLRPRTWVLPKWSTARFLFDLSREHRAGKIQAPMQFTEECAGRGGVPGGRFQDGSPTRLAPSGLSVRKEHEYEEWRFYLLVIPLAGMIDFKVVDLASGLECHNQPPWSFTAA